MKDVTVRYKGNDLIISKFVADQFGLKEGQNIYSESLFWQIIEANATHNLTALRSAMQNKN